MLCVLHCSSKGPQPDLASVAHNGNQLKNICFIWFCFVLQLIPSFFTSTFWNDNQLKYLYPKPCIRLCSVRNPNLERYHLNIVDPTWVRKNAMINWDVDRNRITIINNMYEFHPLRRALFYIRWSLSLSHKKLKRNEGVNYEYNCKKSFLIRENSKDDCSEVECLMKRKAANKTLVKRGRRGW